MPPLVDMDRTMKLKEGMHQRSWKKLRAENRIKIIIESHEYLKGLCRRRASRRDSNTGSFDDAGDLRIDSWKSRLDK